MKTIFSLYILFLFSHTFSQTLNADTEYYDAVDKWVAIPAQDSLKSQKYIYGFIYIDTEAGFTFEVGKYFGENALGKYEIINPTDTTGNSMKFRIPVEWGKVALLSDQRIKELNLPKVPEWLKYYKEDEKTPQYLLDMGYFYNHVGASHHAISPLLQANSLDPDLKGLSFEIAYAYNAMKEFDKAILFLNSAIQKSPADCFLYRELVYSYRYSDRLQQAEETYNQALNKCENASALTEMGVNMAQVYFLQKNESKFRFWLEEARKYAQKGSQYDDFLNLLESEWTKENSTNLN